MRAMAKDKPKSQTRAVFRSGDYSHKVGFPFRVDAKWLADFAAAYNKASDPAPVVLGHPKDNAAPARGWVNFLQAVGDTLMANITPTAEFDEMLKDGSYKKISLSLNVGDTAEKTTLRHLGFLGAVAPEVEGLPLIQFSANSEHADCYVDFSKGGDNPPSIQPETTMDNPDDKNKNADFAQREAALKEQAAALEKQRADFAKQQAEADEAALTAQIASWSADGKMPKALAEQFGNVYRGLHAARRVADFAEGDNAVTKAIAEFDSAIDSLGKSALFSELPKDKTADKVANPQADAAMIANFAKQNNCTEIDAEAQLRQQGKLSTTEENAQ